MIAVIGVASRFSQAKDSKEFFEKICAKSDLIGEFPKERRQDALPFVEGMYFFNKKEHIDYQYSKGSYLDRIDTFDNEYFRISPKEAEVMDPNQRIFLEVGINALEDAGYGGTLAQNTNTGVFVGFMPDFRPFNYKDLWLLKPEESIDMRVPGNLPSIIPSRLSYFLNLKGPSLLIDTACSSSLVAIHEACESLRRGECSMALAGGIKLTLAPIIIVDQQVAFESKSGRSKPFDNDADGVGIGEGCGIVVLKPLADAIRDKDSIYAVIKGSAINQDGRSLGIAAPNGAAQKVVIEKAWEASGIDPKNVELIEAHGTGTSLGDPIEVNALKAAFEQITTKRQFCFLTSVKSNMGHLYEGSGMPSFIKTVLSIKNKKKAPTLHFNMPNQKIDFGISPFYVGQEVEEWNSDKRVAGINSFGMSGTNCHMVLENLDRKSQARDNANDILVISAKSLESLREMLLKYTDFLMQTNESLSDICYTAAIGRSHFEYRAAFIGNDKSKVASLIRTYISTNSYQEDTVDKVLSPMAASYLAGRTNELISFYENQDRIKISIPGYIFKSTRHWIRFDPAYIESIVAKNPIHYERLFLPDVSPKLGLDAKGTTVLVLHCNQSRAKAIANYFIASTRHVIDLIVTPDTVMSEIASLIVENNIDHIVDLTTIDGGAYGLVALSQLRHLAKALLKVQHPLQLSLVSSFATGIDREDSISAENFSYLAFGKVIQREIGVKCSAFDIDNETDATNIALDILLARNQHYLRCWRKNLSYVEHFSPINFANKEKKLKSTYKNGCSIITGGTGGLGLTIAKSLSLRGPVRLALLSRFGISDDAAYRDLINQLEKAGGQIRVYQVDVANYQDLKAVIAQIEKDFGEISNIYHCAGLPSRHLISKEPEKAFQAVLDVKIIGTKNIHELTKHMNLDFLALFSSVATFFPAIGQGSYCAANSYLDAFAEQAQRQGHNVVSLSWVAWRDIGMAKDFGSNVDTTVKAISNEQAIDAMEKAIAYLQPHCLIGEFNYQYPRAFESLVEYQIILDPSIVAKFKEAKNQTADEMIHDIDCSLVGRESGIYTEMEIAIAKIWARRLGYKEIHIKANLYDDLGAESLVAAMIIADCQTHFKCHLNVVDILTSSSVESLTTKIEAIKQTKMVV